MLRRSNKNKQAQQNFIPAEKYEGLKMDDFTLGDTLGTGTFGRVRLVRFNTKFYREGFYAMKILKKSEIIRLKQVEHIKAEREILSRITHPYIVNMFGTFQNDERVYMLFEYVCGGELFSYLRNEGRFPNETSKFYTIEIALAFQYLHSLDIVYRDLKPENLLIAANGHMKITDFGFAKVVTDRTWTLCGTPEYLAPEIIQSKGHSKSVDWWALGVLIFEMLAGYPPFYDENPFGIYQKILAGKIEFPRHMDIKGKDLIKRLLTADRTKRLGCLKKGAEDIKKHKWFGKQNFDDYLSFAVIAPYIPEVEGEGDTRNFDEYPDSYEESPHQLTAEEIALFPDF